MVIAHDKISPTAKFVAYLRTLTDIPYSAEIAAACNAKQAFEEIVGDNPQDFLWLAPMVEMRYKSVDKMLRQYFHHSTQLPNVLELASGVSPRGLIWTKTELLSYFETDLNEILSEKKVITTSILGDEVRENLEWLAVNAVEKDDFEILEIMLSSRSLSRCPIAVVCEGLLPYFSHAEKEKVARNIHQLLKNHGGIWVTPDISSNDRLKELMAIDPSIGVVMQRISGLTGRDIKSNSFTSMEEAEQFFVNIGFKVTKWNQGELVPQLSALDKVQVEPKKLEIMLDRGKVWVLEVQ